MDKKKGSGTLDSVIATVPTGMTWKYKGTSLAVDVAGKPGSDTASSAVGIHELDESKCDTEKSIKGRAKSRGPALPEDPFSPSAVVDVTRPL